MTPLFVLLLLAVIQGLTEYLPVSSSGHLVLFREWLPAQNFPANASLEIWLHLGTLMAVLVFYRQRIKRLTLGFFGCGEDFPAQRRLLTMLAIASIPAGVVGFCFETQLSQLFGFPGAAAGALLFTGAVLWLSPKFNQASGHLSSLGWTSAFLIGLAQAIAIAPGISRSGMTIVAGLALGLRVKSAAAFSFLLSIPAILAAAGLKIPHLMTDGQLQIPIVHLIASFVLTFGVGWLALRWLVLLATKNRLHWFAPYCWLLGGATLAKTVL